MSSLHIIYASTSGHTLHVVETACAAWKEMDSSLEVEVQRVELATPEDLLRGDVLILASGSWNTGSVEGMLNPYIHRFLINKAADIDLQGKKIGLIGLGDERYHFTVGCIEHFKTFIKDHNGEVLEPILKIVNEPYGQEEKIQKWAKEFAAQHVGTSESDVPTGNASPSSHSA